jgi:Uma2 family endonuclease
MGAMDELIEAPLTPEELGARFRALCEDPLLANVPGKIELDLWGRMFLTPFDNRRGMLKGRIASRIAGLAGQGVINASVLTRQGVSVADVAWCSEPFARAHGTETPFTRAPEICVEVVSPSNSRKALEEKVAGYLAAGAVEAWIVYPKSKRVQCFGKAGELAASAYAVDLTGLFD